MSAFYETVFLGGGISCLAAARSLRGDSILLEREQRPGGLCKSDSKDGFTFDRTGHLLHLSDPRVRSLIRRLLGANLKELRRNSWIFSNEVYTRYPFQSHFYGLPPRVAAECLLGVFRAQSGKRRAKSANFAAWVRDRFGDGIARHFMFPYNRKLWTVPPASLTTEWLQRFVPRPDLEQVVRGAFEDLPDQSGYNASFFYPKKGGINVLPAALAKGVSKLECGVSVRKIEIESRKLVTSSGDVIGFGRLVSCIGLPELIKMIRPVPDRIRKAACKLRWSSVYNLNLGLRGVRTDKHWVYVPEDKFALYRFGFANNFSRSVAPFGASNVYCEVAYSRRRPIDHKKIRKRVIDDLLAMRVIGSRKDIILTHEFRLPIAYVTYDKNRRGSVATLLKFLQSKDIFSIGRYGRWEYGSMEDAISQGLSVAATLS